MTRFFTMFCVIVLLVSAAAGCDSRRSYGRMQIAGRTIWSYGPHAAQITNGEEGTVLSVFRSNGNLVELYYVDTGEAVEELVFGETAVWDPGFYSQGEVFWISLEVRDASTGDFIAQALRDFAPQWTGGGGYHQGTAIPLMPWVVKNDGMSYQMANRIRVKESYQQNGGSQAEAETLSAPAPAPRQQVRTVTVYPPSIPQVPR